jgi:hypothetical protein
MRTRIFLLSCLALVGLAGTALAADYSRLGKDLTPIGAEKAGNADGSIPAWDGGWTKVDPSWKAPGGDRPNPFADDKILYTITKENMAQYADKLPEASKALLQARPEAFQINVYPTRRSVAYPQWVYDMTRDNAGKCQLIDDGNGVGGCTTGIPFPIPQSAEEIIWNHYLRFQGKAAYGKEMNEYLVYGNGKTQHWAFENVRTYPWWDDSDPEDDKNGIIYKHSSTVTLPARDSGEGILVIDNKAPAQVSRMAWTYDPGERRVRRAPNVGFDTPDRACNTYDDLDGMTGTLEMWDWKILGKKELIIPYNNNEINKSGYELAFAQPVGFPNKDLLRWELHRVWVVEATLKEGKRHSYSRRVHYIDEDSWAIKVAEKYDGNGDLWRMSYFFGITAPEIPTTATGINLHVDLKNDAYYTLYSTHGLKQSIDYTAPSPPATYYTAAALRKRGR